MQTMIDELRGQGYSNVLFVSLNTVQAEAALPQYVGPLSGPVLQDQQGDPVHALLGAATYSLWVVDRQARPRFRHDHITLPADEATLHSELLALLQENAR